MASALRRKCHSPRQERHPREEHRLVGREQAEELWELTEVCKEQLAMTPKGKEPMTKLGLTAASPHQNWDPMGSPSNQQPYDLVNWYGG